MATSGTAPEQEARPAPTAAAVQAVADPRTTTADPGLETAARGATEFKEDAVTITPVPTQVKAEETVGARYEQATANRMARRDAAVRYDVAVCNNCGHRETLPAGGPPRTSYMACPVCGDTLRFTGVPVRDPSATPLPAIADDEMRSG